MKYVVANWKMHLSAEDARALAEEMVDMPIAKDVQCILCPPSLWLSQVMTIGYDRTDLYYGAQDCSAYAQGAYTGDISADMIASQGAHYVILGHSERRQHHGESNDMVRAKAEKATEAGLIPIICVGETKQEREAGQAEDVVKTQLSVFQDLIDDESRPVGRVSPEPVSSRRPVGRSGKQTEKAAEQGQIIIAYEPVWAIGTGLVPEITDIEAMHAHIHRFIDAPVLYGGSVKADNAAEIMAVQGVDGALVGGASLQAEQFAAIIAAAGA